MAKDSRSARKNQHRDLKKLQEQGLYGGRLDLRKRVSDYQKRILRKFDDVLKGLAKVLTPQNPRNYKEIFKVTRNKVVVPKAPGERVRVNKAGNVERTRRGPRGELIRQEAIPTGPTKVPPQPPPGRRVQYAIPFARKVGRGQYKMEWHRFPDWETLNDFMKEYEAEGRYQDWLNYVFEEEITDFSRDERDRALDQALVDHGRVRDASHIVDAGRAVRSRRRRNVSGRRWKNRRDV